MCGIVCCLCAQDSPDENLERKLLESVGKLIHRGPDGSGTFVSASRCVCLGHARLSLIDLEGGKQPISNEQGNIHIIVNGEFYGFEELRASLKERGHIFSTSSDSEVALHLYEDFGVDFLQYIHGEFALCIFDERCGSLVIARDRFGAKPLYYANIDNKVVAASEIKALLPFGLVPQWNMNPRLLGGVLRSRQCMSTTVFSNIFSLNPAHYAVINCHGNMRKFRYWDCQYPDVAREDMRTKSEIADDLLKHLRRAVELRLRADVPVGVLLSGGIDSAACLGLAHSIQLGKGVTTPLHAFTISFEHASFDEAKLAESMAKSCDSVFHRVSLTEKDLIEAFPQVILHCEQPINNFGPVGRFLLAHAVSCAGFKAVLGGEGSDEIFGGYEGIEEIMHREDGFSVNHFLIDPFTRKLPLFHASAKEGVLSSDIINTSMDVWTNSRAKSWHPLNARLYKERELLELYFLPCLGDRVEMANSVEGRLPYLDTALVEFVNYISPSWKVHDGSEKYILKETVRPFVTQEIYQRKKYPYNAPPLTSLARESIAST